MGRAERASGWTIILVWLGLALVVSGTVALGARHQRVAAAGDCAAPTVELDDEERAFLAALNDYRAQRGLKALVVSATLNRAADWLARDMAGKRYFSHSDSAGRDPSKRASDCGYPGQAGENIAAGGDWGPGLSVFEAWRGSPGHNQNMLSPTYATIGIARAYDPGAPFGWYWVTDFGALIETPPATATQPATPAPDAPKPGRRQGITLYAGANLITWVNAAASPEAAIASAPGAVTVVYAFDKTTGAWRRFAPGLPAYVNTLTSFERGAPYWVIARAPAEIRSEP